MHLPYCQCDLLSYFLARFVSHSALLICLLFFFSRTNAKQSFLIAIPAIAQLVVNKSDLRIVNAEVLHPTKDTVRMTLEAKVNLKLALGVRLDPVVFYTFVRSAGHENAYAGIDIPGQTIKGNYSLGVTNQLTPILNMTSWETFVSQTVFQKESALSLYGVTTGYLGVLKNHIVLDKDVVIPSEYFHYSVVFHC